MPPAARITDNVTHLLPPVLTQGPGSPDVIIGGLPAWRGIPGAAVVGLQAAKQTSDVAIRTAEAATAAAAGTPGAPVAKAAEETTKATAAETMGYMISSVGAGADIHMCSTPLPAPPHGPGVVIDGSPTVLINNMPACRMGDTILEAVGPPNKIIRGEPTVIIGNTGGGNPSAEGGGGQGRGESGTGQASGTSPQEGAGTQVSTETGGVPRFGNALAEAAETGDAFCEICLE
ncbi:MAG: PAAR domain-containing protein [Bryobacteraceae bacterium]|nr:PAAR domain-containing protein [Bryobacterales bacterium]MEB2360126.1 PAAR domain-containing protein [Bryobacterales bacterium]NUN00533.1 PAAR domain-containing protein [Bryobacteraceae bacterium]